MSDAFDQPPTTAPRRISSRPLTIALSCVLAAITALYYSNTLYVPLVFDDGPRIEHNPAIHTLWPLSVPTADTSRPLGMLSFAVNYALHGTRVWGYHITNLAIHILAGLMLFGIARRTLTLPRLADRYRQYATGLAFAIALVWLVHPLNTQAVTYTVQRLESLMGLFYLATLYGFIRAQDSSRRSAWYLASIACCAAGMAVKEVMITAPFVVVVYHRVFIADSWRDVFKEAKLYYAGLFSTWIILAWCLLRTRSEYTAGNLLFVEGVMPWTYFLSQSEVVAHYLRLAFWPNAQSIDYAWPVVQNVAQVVPSLLLLGLLAALTVWALFRRPAWGFLGLCFFVTLSPTSSIVPIIDLAFEQRMYLPLTTLAALIVCLFFELTSRSMIARRAIYLQLAVLLVVAVVLGTLTVRRNAVYASEKTLWNDVVAKRPNNARGHNNLGLALYHERNFAESAAQCREAIRLKPNFPEAHNNLGNALQEQGQVDAAIEQYQEAIRLRPIYSEAGNNLGNALQKLGKFHEAVGQYKKVIEAQPENAEAHNNLGSALVGEGNLEAAIEQYRIAIRLKPDFVGAIGNLGITLQQQGNPQAAIEQFDNVLRLQPDSAQTYLQRSVAHYQQGKFAAAWQDLESAKKHGVTPPPEYVQILETLKD